MFIVKGHNLKEKNYHTVGRTTYYNAQAKEYQERYTWVDKACDRFKIEADRPDLFTKDEPMAVLWLMNRIKREFTSDSKATQEEFDNLPEAYDNVIRLKFILHKPSKQDKLYQHINLERKILSNSMFSITTMPTVCTATLPTNNQSSNKAITEWVTSSAVPLGNLILYPTVNSLDTKHLKAKAS